MRVIALEELPGELRAFVRAAAAGETILVIDGEKVVAEIVPARDPLRPRPVPRALSDAVRRGWGAPAAPAPGAVPPSVG